MVFEPQTNVPITVIFVLNKAFNTCKWAKCIRFHFHLIDHAKTTTTAILRQKETVLKIGLCNKHSSVHIL